MGSVGGPRILILDIETSANLAWVFSLHGEHHVSPNQIMERSAVLCFAAKWHGKPKVHFHSTQNDGRLAMVKAAHKLMDEADAIVHYNGRAFDMKHLRREFLLAGLGPPSPHIDIDLLTVVRKKFRFPSNKLANIAIELGLEGKADTGGFDTWVGCWAGDKQAWATMKSYNIQDVRQTEKVYDRLLPWIDNHPHWGLYGPRFHEEDRCQRCGSPDLMRRGYYATQVGRYPRFQCNKCGGYSRSKRRVGTVDARGVA